MDKAHTWVSLQYAPIDVELTTEGNLNVFVSEGAADLSEQEAMMGCWFCHTPLTVESYGSTCEVEKITQKL